MRLHLALITLLALHLAACASGGVITSGALRALHWQSEAPKLVPIERLELPREAELFIAPVAWKGPEAGSDGQPQRLQIVVRATRLDGGVHQWFIGADGRASEGERGFQLPIGIVARDTFGGADYGPVRLVTLSALEVAVAQLPLEPRRAPVYVGLAQVQELASATKSDRARLSDAGVGSLLAVKLPVVLVDGGLPGTQTLRVIFAGGEGSAGTEIHRLHGLRGHEALDESGQSVPGLSSLVLDLRVTIPEHR